MESSRGRLSPAKSEDRKGGEGKTDANLTIFLSTFPAGHILLQVFIFVASRLSAWTLVRRAMVAPARAPANAPTAMLNRFISILTSVGSHRRVGAALVQVPEVFAAQKLDADFLGVCQVCAAIPPGPLPERNLKSLQRDQLLDILLRAADFSRHLRQGPRLAASIPVQLRWEKPGCAWEEQTRTKHLSPCDALLGVPPFVQTRRTDTDSEFVWHLPAGNTAMPCRKLVRGDEPRLLCKLNRFVMRLLDEFSAETHSPANTVRHRF